MSLLDYLGSETCDSCKTLFATRSITFTGRRFLCPDCLNILNTSLANLDLECCKARATLRALNRVPAGPAVRIRVQP